MQLRSIVRDCLYVNWALPERRLPPTPEPLRYELHRHRGERFGFVSAVLFRQTGLRLSAMPWIRLSYPELNVRFYVVDDEGVPAVLFRSLMVPGWVVPLAQVSGHGWLDGARLEYPRPSRDTGAAAWTWRAAARGRLEIRGRTGAPAPGPGPEFGPWVRTCDYFRRRDRGYVQAGGRLRGIETTHPTTTIWPMAIEVAEAELLRGLLAMPPADPWPAVHSAWLCPRVPLDFEIAGSKRAVLARRVPAPG
jgi:Uncharacterized conserved protein (COG2071)